MSTITFFNSFLGEIEREILYEEAVRRVAANQPTIWSSVYPNRYPNSNLTTLEITGGNIDLPGVKAITFPSRETIAHIKRGLAAALQLAKTSPSVEESHETPRWRFAIPVTQAAQTQQTGKRETSEERKELVYEIATTPDGPQIDWSNNDWRSKL